MERGYTEQFFFTCIRTKHKERLWFLFFGGMEKKVGQTSTSLLFQWTPRGTSFSLISQGFTERTGIIQFSVVAEGMNSISAAGMALQGWKRHISDASQREGKECSMPPKLAVQCTTHRAGFYLTSYWRDILTDMIDIDPTSHMVWPK